MKLRPHGSRPARSAGSRKLLRGVVATALALLVVLGNRAHAQTLKGAEHLKKLDGLLRLDVDQQAAGARRVVVPAESLEALAKSAKVLGISADAIVRPHGLLDGLVGGLLGSVTKTVTGTVGLLVNTVGNILDPALDDASVGEPVSPALLRAT